MDPLNREDELDERLAALFKSVDRPAPSAGFASRTMQAIAGEPVPAGRAPLRHWWRGAAGWAALVAGVGAACWFAVQETLAVELFASMLALGIHAGAWLAGLAGAGLVVSDLFATTGRAVARAAATKEGFTTLLLMAAAGACSLLALHRLLFSEMESSEWQETQ